MEYLIIWIDNALEVTAPTATSDSSIRVGTILSIGPIALGNRDHDITVSGRC